jgi:hypothetical protein
VNKPAIIIEQDRKTGDILDVFTNDPTIKVSVIYSRLFFCARCGTYHRTSYAGDCRDDSERFVLVG